jgi:hypothetical protein
MYWTYMKWSLEFLAATPFAFVTAGLLINLMFSLFPMIRNGKLPLLRRPLLWWLLILQFVCFPLTLLVAVAGRVPPIPWPRQEPHPWAIISSDAIVVFSIACGALAVFKMKGQRWFVTSIVLLQLWFLQGAGLVAASSLTGVWP